MAPHRCSYFMCKNNSNEKSMFSFPCNDAERLKVWLENCGNISIAHLSKKRLRSRYLCIDHFNKKYVRNKTGVRKRLCPDAVPAHYKNIDVPNRSRSPSSGNKKLLSCNESQLKKRLICVRHFKKDSVHKGATRTRLIGPAVPFPYVEEDANLDPIVETKPNPALLSVEIGNLEIPVLENQKVKKVPYNCEPQLQPHTALLDCNETLKVTPPKKCYESKKKRIQLRECIKEDVPRFKFENYSSHSDTESDDEKDPGNNVGGSRECERISNTDNGTGHHQNHTQMQPGDAHTDSSEQATTSYPVIDDVMATVVIDDITNPSRPVMRTIDDLLTMCRVAIKERDHEISILKEQVEELTKKNVRLQKTLDEIKKKAKIKDTDLESNEESSKASEEFNEKRERKRSIEKRDNNKDSLEKQDRNENTVNTTKAPSWKAKRKRNVEHTELKTNIKIAEKDTNKTVSQANYNKDKEIKKETDSDECNSEDDYLVTLTENGVPTEMEADTDNVSDETSDDGVTSTDGSENSTSSYENLETQEEKLYGLDTSNVENNTRPFEVFIKEEMYDANTDTRSISITRFNS
ncbi:uncharacterized protein LOC113520143 isoform X2 [Galleria mellonella]|uniref:Uncharacterized protein LOC113520143 isoform X2 n=1 Tax=Galleria mellonella TaxID=7137 RepID=A0ABM3MSS5_GALME|nr:uncharacterized protein LOC113520143 isoform X2 [Galleria mellonella]XP_052754414.1 uncharacterized protein LOC113520143 isoform X2 [Galleria mellonella]